MTDRPASPTVLAIVSEHGSDGVRRRAVELARESGSHLILWDADAGKSLLEDPLPNQWSGDGEEEQFGDRLSVNDLEAAGRGPLARQVAEARSSGIEAWGWLPSSQDAQDLRDYASRHGVSVVVVPEGSKIGDELGGSGLRVEVAAPR